MVTDRRRADPAAHAPPRINRPDRWLMTDRVPMYNFDFEMGSATEPEESHIELYNPPLLCHPTRIVGTHMSDVSMAPTKRAARGVR